MRVRAGANEWPLVIFTVSTQAAVGATLAGLGYRWACGAGTAWMAPLPPIALALFAAGAAAAFFHLGRPRAARHVLGNLRASWLSREVLLGVAFGAAVLALAVLRPAESAWPPEGRWVEPLAALLGLAFVYAVARIYMLRTVPAWNTWATPAAFFGTALVLGAIVLTAALIFSEYGRGGGHVDLDRDLRWLGLLTASLADLHLLASYLHLRRLADGEGAAKESAGILSSVYFPSLVTRFLCGALGATLVFLATWTGNGSRHAEAIIAGSLLLVAGEVVGRHLFYVSHRRTGL